MAWDEQRGGARRAVVGQVDDRRPAGDRPRRLDGVVVSPGVPLNRHPIAAKAREAGVPVIGDIELFAQARGDLPPHKVVGITGTNGKSTTTALVHHILKTAGVPTTMGGNIGLPILGQDPLPEGGVYVLELSSYQIDLTHSLDCDVAVLLNVTPDHLDRYESFEAYAASKARLFEMQSPRSCRRRWRPMISYLPESSLAINGLDADVASAGPSPMTDEALRRAPVAVAGAAGPHNAQNAAAAVAVGDALEPRRRGDRTRACAPIPACRIGWSGWPSRAASCSSTTARRPIRIRTAPALAAYPHVHWIVGGLAKSDDLGPCEAQLDHVRAAYTIGEAGPMFARLLEDRVPVTAMGSAGDGGAGRGGGGGAGRGGSAVAGLRVVRPVPDYEARGEAFRAAVEALA